MVDFYLVPESIRVLSLVLLNAAITAYLVRVRSERGATVWLATFTGGMAVFYLTRFAMASIFPIRPDSTLQHVLEGVELLVVPVALGGLVQHAYRFLEHPFEREARWALRFTSALFFLLGAFYIASTAASTSNAPWGRIYSLIWLLFSVWAAVVLLRKRRRHRRRASHKAGPSSRTLQAYRTFAALNLLFVLVLVAIFLVAFDILPRASWPFLILPGVFGFFFGLVVAYVTYSPDPTTVQVKLVGLSLATVLAIFGMLAVLLYPRDTIAEESNAYPTAHEDLYFRANADGSYQIASRPAEPSAWSERLDAVGQMSSEVPLSFAFPFGGRTWNRITIGRHGLLTLGADARVPEDGYRPYRDLYRPTIAPFFASVFGPRTRGFYDADLYFDERADRAIVTWVIPLDEEPRPAVVQAVLHEDGSIEMNYDALEMLIEGPMSAPFGRRGIWSGEQGLPDALELAGLRSASLAPGQPAVQDFGIAIRNHLHERSARLLWMMLGSLVFVLLAFPLTFRTTLIRPLRRLHDGMRRVTEGDLAAEVPVGVRDEVGHLTAYFNRMTQSLRRAEAQVRDYADTLEQRVADRTSELQDSLEQLRQTQQQLIQQEKMASLGELTAGIAHEIKNPLNFVTNFSSLSVELLDELRAAYRRGDEEEVRALLDDLSLNAEKIEEHGQRADGIVRAMMLHARGNEGERERVDVDTLVDEYVELAYHGKRATTRDFSVEVERDYGQVGSIELIPQEIGRVVLNLVGNAFDAVTERAARRNGHYMPQVRIATRRSGDHLEIRIEDNGPGIPENVREKIFEPFFTTKPAGSGTGLGLSLSYEIVTQGHGGELTLAESPLGGAAFIIQLPAGRPRPVEAGGQKRVGHVP